MNEQEIQLVKIEELKPALLFSNSEDMASLLATIRSQAKSLVFDINTAKGRGDVISLAAKVGNTKTALEAMGKDQVKDLKAQAKVIDGKRKLMNDTLAALKKEIRLPVTEFEEKEKERVRLHEYNLAQITDIANQAIMFSSTSQEIIGHYKKLKIIVVDKSWEEYQGKAEHEKTAQVFKVKQRYDIIFKQEQDALELAALRKKQEEREQLDREEALKKEAAEKATREANAKAEKEAAAVIEKNALLQAEKEKAERDQKAAEQRAIDAEKQAAQDKIDFDNAASLAKIEAAEKAELVLKEKHAADIQAEIAKAAAIEQVKKDNLAAQKAEKKRIKEESEAKIKADLEAEEKRLANVAHVEQINDAIIGSMTGINISDNDCKKLIDKINRGEIPHVTIKY